MKRVFHCIQVIEISPEFVEAVQRWQVLVAIAKMVLAELSGFVSHRLQRRRDGWCFIWYAELSSRLADGSKTGANRQLTCNEVGAAQQCNLLRRSSR